ncbi:MAG: large conductance mechanosensitive channel protein MscL [Bacteroidales bacterium]|nr:large conductance mechanosensitive channel protein MscL [Bacteroidales bacterium]
MSAKSFVQEFKEFALKGNVVDMAVGVIIGGAFGKIVTSLVNDIIMPLVGSLIGNVDFTTLSATLREPVLGADGEVVKEAVTLNYGNFIQTTVDFIISLITRKIHRAMIRKSTVVWIKLP